MWGNKSWDGAKKKEKREKLEQTQDGSTCKFCSKIPENACIKCGADICPQHTKYYRDNFSSAFKEIFCPDCRKRSLNRRTIMVGLTIAVIVWISVAQPGFLIPPTTELSINHPSDIVYEFGSTSNSITWVCSDLDNYELFIDEISQGSTAWVGGNITENIDGLSLGAHNVTLIIFSGSGYWVQDEVIVTVTAA